MRFVYHAEDDKLAHIASAYVLPHHTQHCNLHIYCILRYIHKESDGWMIAASTFIRFSFGFQRVIKLRMTSSIGDVLHLH